MIQNARSCRAVYEKFKDGTIKDISNELPFDIPVSWKWVRFGDVTLNRDAERIPLSKDQRSHLAKNFDYYGASGIIDKVDQYLFDKPLLLVGEDGANLLARSTPIAFIASGKYWVNNHAHVIDAIEFDLLKYLEIFINAIPLTPYITGTAQPKMNQEKMNGIVVPLPPLAEQKRIVAKIEKLMPLVEEYGKMEETRIQLDANLPVALEKSILQESIQGKLVPQDPNDEPANELLKRIAAERKALVKAGKLKASKGESVVFRGSDRLAYETRNGETVCIQDEIPFEIPDSWEWVRLGALIKLISGVSYKKNDVSKNGIRILRGGNVKGDGKLYLYEDDVFLPESYANDENEIRKDDVVIVAATGSSTVIGRAAIVSTDMTFVQIGAFLRIARPLFADVSTWIALIFHSPFYRQHIQEKAKGTNIRNLKAEYITDFLIPLPPLAEQKRIVKRVEELKAAARTLATF